MIITFAEDRILRSFAVLPFLTVAQIIRLFYSPGSGQYVRALLKQLHDHRYLTRQALPSDIRAGSVPYVYALAQRGRTYLDSLGYDLLGKPSASTDTAHSYLFLAHTLAVTDVLIAAVLLPRYTESIALADVRHDVTLKRLLRGFVVPDGFIDLRIHGTVQHCFFLELDRGTESKAHIQQKLIGTLRFIQPGAANEQSVYERLFETTSLTIVYAMVGQPEKRVSDIAHWTNEVLTETGNIREADLFRFASVPSGPLDPVWFFLTPVWKHLMGTSLVPLVKL